jgi:hypothetical protein
MQKSVAAEIEMTPSVKKTFGGLRSEFESGGMNSVPFHSGQNFIFGVTSGLPVIRV